MSHKTIQQRIVQGNLFEPTPDTKEYYEFTCLVNKQFYNDFIVEFSQFCKEFHKYDVGNYFQIECLTSSLYRANKEKEKYFVTRK